MRIHKKGHVVENVARRHIQSLSISRLHIVQQCLQVFVIRLHRLLGPICLKVDVPATLSVDGRPH